MDLIQKNWVKQIMPLLVLEYIHTGEKNENQPVAYARYQMLMAYLNLSRSKITVDLHDYPQYGAFICGSQVQLDVSKSNYLMLSMLYSN